MARKNRVLTPDDYGFIASSVGLNSREFTRYSLFMQRRFPQEKDEWHATKWAERFKRGEEYEWADEEGIKILKEIDKSFPTIRKLKKKR
jgi:hypothetical protein